MSVILWILDFMMKGMCVFVCILVIVGWYAFLYAIRYREMENQ